jgi:hypothetical protein
MSNSNIDKVVEQVASLFTTVDQVLHDWQGEGNLQFPTLFGLLAAKTGWDEKQLKDVDPLVRYYVRNSEDWCVTRGARGGIMRASDKRKKLEALQNKDLLKKKMKEKIEEQAAATQLATQTITSSSSDLEDSLEDDFDQEVEDSIEDELM